MGGCSSRDDAQVSLERQHQSIESNTRKKIKDEGNVVKVLLLGAGESGKSTVFKQMTRLFGDGFTDDEREFYRTYMHRMMVTSMYEMITYCRNAGIALDAVTNNAQLHILDGIHSLTSSRISDTTRAALHILWMDPAIQTVFRDRSAPQIPDNVDYFYCKLDQIVDAAYVPSDDDMLRLHVRTTGINQRLFQVKGGTIKLIDVGGQKNERRKWIHCFENVLAVIFVAAISEYDQMMYEDPTKNRLEDALDLFRQVLENDWFKQTTFLLFLNKRDVFSRKLEQVSLSTVFPQCKAGTDVAKAEEFMADLFASRIPAGKQVITHVTCATSTDNMSFILEAVQNTIITTVLQSNGIM